MAQTYARQDPQSVIKELYELYFATELNPVALKAQRKVRVPEDLDLDAWIGPQPQSNIHLFLSDEETVESENELDVGTGRRKSKRDKNKDKKVGRSMTWIGYSILSVLYVETC
jgi:AP-3 complex subunit delta-1